MNHKIYSNKTFQTKAKDIAFDSLFNLFPINFSWIDTEGYILGCNQQVLDSQSISSFTDIIGKHTVEVASELAWENTQKVLKSGQPLTAEEIHTRKDGTKIYFLSMKTPMKDCSDKIIGVVNIALDITERKSMEMNLSKLKEAAELADKVKTDFLINMRHDLRTPLSGIVTISEFLEHREPESSKKSYLQNIKNCAESMLAHLNEILDHIKAESGEFSIIEKEFNIHDILRDIYRILLPSAQAKGLDFTLTLDPIPVLFIGDIARIERILLNVISNAIKFTEKGYVRITANWVPISNEKGILEFIIEDSGIGIPEDKIDIVFEKFHRLNPSYEGVYSGSGLGLYMVKQFIEELKGNYELKSQLGEGTQFKIRVPYKIPVVKINLSTSDFAIPSENLSTKSLPIPCENLITTRELNSKTHKILLVEDHQIISQISKKILENLDCKVDVAPDGKTALEFVNQYNYDLVLMDIGLPDMDGYTVTQKIRLNKNKIISDVPIIAITAHSEDEESKKCLEAGMLRMITKPLTQEIAESIISQLS